MKAEGPEQLNQCRLTIITLERRLHSWHLSWVPWAVVNRNFEIEFFSFGFLKKLNLLKIDRIVK